jgi:hypothetical protein
VVPVVVSGPAPVGFFQLLTRGGRPGKETTFDPVDLPWFSFILRFGRCAALRRM